MQLRLIEQENAPRYQAVATAGKVAGCPKIIRYETEEIKHSWCVVLYGGSMVMGLA